MTLEVNLKCLALNQGILFASGAAQMVWCHAVPKLSALVILGMDWLTQLNPKINWSEKLIEWTLNNTNGLQIIQMYFWKLVV